MAGDQADVNLGHALPLRRIPPGTMIHNVELVQGLGGLVAQVELGEVAPGMRGRIDGNADIEIQSVDNAVTAMNGRFDAPQGAQIPAAFLQPVVSYIPASTQRDILEKLIAAGTDVFFDHANVRVKSARSDSLNLLIKMDSKKLNLDLAVTVDLNVEGGLKSLLDRLPQLAPGSAPPEATPGWKGQRPARIILPPRRPGQASARLVRRPPRRSPIVLRLSRRSPWMPLWVRGR